MIIFLVECFHFHVYFSTVFHAIESISYVVPEPSNSLEDIEQLRNLTRNTFTFPCTLYLSLL